MSANAFPLEHIAKIIDLQINPAVGAGYKGRQLLVDSKVQPRTPSGVLFIPGYEARSEPVLISPGLEACLIEARAESDVGIVSRWNVQQVAAIVSVALHVR